MTVFNPMSLLDEIEQQGNRLAAAEAETRAALAALAEANAKLTQEVQERAQAERRLRILCDTMSDHSISLPERIIRMLREACENFSMDTGILASIEDQKYTIIYTWSNTTKPREDLFPGAILDLKNTYCRALDTDGTSIGKNHIGDSDWHTHPLYVSKHIESYLGVCVLIHQKFWGALCFTNVEERPKDFSQPDHDFLRLMAQWIGAEMSLQKQRLEP